MPSHQTAGHHGPVDTGWSMLDWTPPDQVTVPPALLQCRDHDFSVRLVFAPQGQLCALRVQVQSHADADPEHRGPLWPQLRDYARATRLPVWARVKVASLLNELVQQGQSDWLQVEVPTFLAQDEAWAQSLDHGPLAPGLVVSGRPAQGLAPQVLRHTRAVILDRDQERRRACMGVDTGMTALRRIPFLYDQCEHRTHLADAIEMGAAGVVGHEGFFQHLPDTMGDARRTELELCWSLLQLAWPPGASAALRRVLSAHPRLQSRTMALLQWVKHPGLPPIESLDDALTLPLRPTLLRALSILPLCLENTPHQRALRLVALRRGWFLDRLVQQDEADWSLSDTAYVASALSLAARGLGLDLLHLANEGVLPQPVCEALMDEGPAAPWLDLAHASDTLTPFDVQELAQQLFLDTATVNRALLDSVQRCSLAQASWV